MTQFEDVKYVENEMSSYPLFLPSYVCVYVYTSAGLIKKNGTLIVYYLFACVFVFPN